MSQAQLRIGTYLAGAYRGQRGLGENRMAKITIVKGATVNAKPQGFCPIFVDDTPMPRK